MKVLEKAIIKAMEKDQNDKDFSLCLNNLVCPKCGGDLETGFFPAYAYECKKCNFCFTSAQEAELEKRLKHGRAKYM